ncbi:AAA family ATPase [Aminobacter aganoensis]|nr:ATP-binding protein [Aminobacter aganoensis]
MMEARLARFFVRRLRRRATSEAVHDAVASGILRVLPEDRADFESGASPRAFAVGPLVAGTSAEEALRMIRRSSAAGRARRSDDNADFFRTTSVKLRNEARRAGEEASQAEAESPRVEHQARALLDAVRASAMPLRAGDVAAALLVAQAAGKSGLPPAEIAAALSMLSPMVTLTAEVEGFEETVLGLLAGGVLAPGRVAVCEGSELSRSGSQRFSRARDPRWHAIVFKASELDDDGDWRERQLGFAAESGYPIVGISERGPVIPEVLRRVAAVHLDCGSLTPDIVMNTMLVVLGSRHDDHLDPEHTAVLALSDLALAIRPGQSPARAFALLGDLGRRRIRAKQETRRAGSAGHATAGGLVKRKTGRGSGSGADVIQPRMPGSTATDRFLPRIETLAGYGEAAEWAMSLKEDLELWRAGELAWSEMSTRILLSGPPGTGKTLFARALCNTLQVPLVATSVATWLEPGYLGDALRRMSATFAEAEAMKPAIVFIDEIDGIGRRERRGEWDQYWTSIVNRGLELLDGAVKTPGVIVVAATNNAQAIDPALLRSGRLEKHVDIPPPGIAALTGILRHHLGDDLETIAASAAE